MAAVTTQLRQQAVAGNVLLSSTSSTGANAVALALNAARFQLCWLQSADNGTGEIAAAAAAARLIGNGAVGGALVGEATDPAANLDGMDLPGIRVQDAVSDVPTPTTVESELNVGVCALVPSSLNPGYVKMARSITTLWQDASGNPNFAVIDTTDVTVPDFVADDLQVFLASTYQGVKLGVDDPSGSGPTIPNMTTPKLIRQTVLERLFFHQGNGVIINVAGHVNDLNVVASNTVVGTVLMDVPVVPAPGLHILGGNVRQLSF
jgi:phage tail sheath gpL-like